MYRELSYEEMLKLNNYVCIDLRTPKEYHASTIPGAVNIPIFSDEEREQIGTMYTKISVEDAKRLGMDLVGKRLSSFYDAFRNIAKGKQMVLFCARGGLRSRVMSATMGALGLPIIKLDLGYKGYRSYVVEQLPVLLQQVRFVTLFGKTGTGKTNILNILKEKGMDVLDLEACANHRGSLLGSIGLAPQNTQKQFENLVMDMLLHRKTDLIFTEGESKRIGNIIMPTPLYDRTREGDQVLVDAPISFRVANIQKEYIKESTDVTEIVVTLKKLEKYISPKTIETYIEALGKDQVSWVIEKLMTQYYDQNYQSRDRYFDHQYWNTEDALVAQQLVDDFVTCWDEKGYE